MDKNEIKAKMTETKNTVRRASIEDCINAVIGMASAEEIRDAAIEWYKETYRCGKVPADSLARILKALGFPADEPKHETAPFNPNW